MATATANSRLHHSTTATTADSESWAAPSDLGLPELVIKEAPTTGFDPEFNRSRQRVLTYLVKLNRSLERGVWDLADTLLQKFCQSLTHYLSVGHQQTFAMNQPAPHQYVAIAATSREVMRFADEFGRQANDARASFEQVYDALETLALTLESRFQLEDELRLGLDA